MVDLPQVAELPSAKLFEILSSSRNSLRRDNANNVKTICDQMMKDRVMMTPAEVSRRCMQLFGGPATSTITNTGSQLGEYVKLRIIEQKAGLKGGARIVTPLSDDVADPILAAGIRVEEERARMLTRENHGLRNLLRKMSNFDIDKELKRLGNGQKAVAVEKKTQETLQINSSLQAVFLKLMDHLISERQYESYRGRLTVNKKIVLTPQEYESFRRATGLSDEMWTKRYGAL